MRDILDNIIGAAIAAVAVLGLTFWLVSDTRDVDRWINNTKASLLGGL